MPPPAGASITQTSSDWLDLSPFQDLFVWVAVSEVSPGGGRVDLFLETSPTDDESLFQPMNGFTGTTPNPAIQNLTAATTPYVLKYPMLSATIPLSRFLRWRLYNGTAAATQWDATLRIVVAANSPGM